MERATSSACHVLVWEFFVRDGCEREFAEIYGPCGDWAALFAKSAAYIGTELLRDATDPRRYLTIDRWTSAAAFDELRRTHGAAYETLDARCAALTDTETTLGAWDTTL